VKGSSRVAGFGVAAALGVALLSVAVTAHAQAPGQERGPGPNALKLLVVPAFVSSDKTLGCSAANEVRDRMDGDVDTKKLWMIQQNNIDETLKASGFPPCQPISATDEKQLTQQLRGDAYIEGQVTKTATGVRIEPRLVLARDIAAAQPLPAVEAAKVGDAAKQVSKEVLAAMKQYDGEEKCYNLARQGQYPQAIAAAKEGIAQYPQASLARLCIANTLVAMKAPPDSIIAVTTAILKDDPKNTRALTLSAQAYYDKKDYDNAVKSWGGLLAADPSNTAMVEDIVTKIVQSGKADAAVPIVAQALKDNPDDPKMTVLYCRILLAAKHTKEALEACPAAVKVDTAFADTLYFARMTTAALADSQPQKAAQFAADGLHKFPNSTTLMQLGAQANVAAGQTQVAMDLLKKLLAINPKNPSAWEQLYNAYIGGGKYDSAMAAAHSAVANGDDPTAMSGYIRTQGNNFYKKGNAANPKNVDTLLMAVRWSKYSDSLAANPGAKFIGGVSEFTVGLQYDQDGTKNKDCAKIKQAEQLWTEAQIDIHGGAAIAPDAAAKILQTIQQYLPAFQQQEKVVCKTGGGAGAANKKQ
jgi:predicted Zn-dependent protease